MYEELVMRLREAPCDWPDADLHYEAADAIEELQGRAKVLEKVADKWCETVPKWISVTERLPEIGETVFVLAYGYDAFTAKMLDQIEYGYPVFECSGFFRELAKPGRITHWMPLPVPPKEET